MSLTPCWLPCLSPDVASTTVCGAAYRTVPRTITSVDSVRRTTGTVIGEGLGAAVSAATCAGERICLAATQPAAATATMAASTRAASRRPLSLFIAAIVSSRYEKTLRTPPALTLLLPSPTATPYEPIEL
jgi:hypothetical protein